MMAAFLKFGSISGRILPLRRAVGFTVFSAVLWTGVSVLAADPSTEDADVQELYRQREQMQKQMDALNASNPLSGEYGNNADLELIEDQEVREKIRTAKQVLEATPLPRLVGQTADPIFQSKFQQLLQHPNRRIWIYLELGCVIFLFLFSTWRQSKPRKWWSRAFVRVQNIVLGLFLISVLAPYVAFGPLYFETLTALLGPPEGTLVQQTKSGGGSKVLESGRVPSAHPSASRSANPSANPVEPAQPDLPDWKKRLNQTQ